MKKMKFLLLLAVAVTADNHETPEEHCAAITVDPAGMDYAKCKSDTECTWMDRSRMMACDATIAGMTINDSRSKYIAFSRGYYTNVLGVMGKQGGTPILDLNELNDALNTILLGADTAPITAIGACQGKTAKDDTCFFPDATITPVSPKCSDDSNKDKVACTDAEMTWKKSRVVAAEMVAASSGGRTYFIHDFANIKAVSDGDANLTIMDFSIKADANTNEMFGMGTRNSDKFLRDAINVALNSVIQDGTYNTKFNAAFGTECGADPSANDFCLHDDSDGNTAKTVWPEADGRLKKIIDAGEMTWCMSIFPPFHDGNGVGFDDDIAKAIVGKIKAQYASAATLDFKSADTAWDTLVNGFGECKAGALEEPTKASPAASLAVGLAILAPIIALL